MKQERVKSFGMDSQKRNLCDTIGEIEKEMISPVRFANANNNNNNDLKKDVGRSLPV